MPTKNRVPILIALLLLIAGIVIFKMSGWGSLVIVNESGKTIHNLVVEIDGAEALTQSEFKDGDKLTVKFNAQAVEGILIETKMKNGGRSRAEIYPGLFAKIQATVLPKGKIDFGKSGYESTFIAFGDWE